MISPFRKPFRAPELLVLPRFCVPVAEPDGLRAKREAQLQWMREKGVLYVGNPSARGEKARRTSASPVKARSDHSARRSEQRIGYPH